MVVGVWGRTMIVGAVAAALAACSSSPADDGSASSESATTEEKAFEIGESDAKLPLVLAAVSIDLPDFQFRCGDESAARGRSTLPWAIVKLHNGSPSTKVFDVSAPHEPILAVYDESPSRSRLPYCRVSSATLGPLPPRLGSQFNEVVIGPGEDLYLAVIGVKGAGEYPLSFTHVRSVAGNPGEAKLALPDVGETASTTTTLSPHRQAEVPAACLGPSDAQGHAFINYADVTVTNPLSVPAKARMTWQMARAQNGAQYPEYVTTDVFPYGFTLANGASDPDGAGVADCQLFTSGTEDRLSSWRSWGELTLAPGETRHVFLSAQQYPGLDIDHEVGGASLDVTITTEAPGP